MIPILTSCSSMPLPLLGTLAMAILANSTVRSWRCRRTVLVCQPWLLHRAASATYYAGNVVPGGKFIYDVGPIGAGNPINAGVHLPFTDSDVTIFRTDISGAASGNIVDVYADNGLPAVLANSVVINGGGGVSGSVPDGGSTVLLLVGSLAALAISKHGGRVWRSLSCSCSLNPSRK